jgi:DNA-directed RNA polymerase specialized sigma24 family protein
MEFTPTLLHKGLDGDKPVLRDLIRTLTPVIVARVSRALLRRGFGQRRDLQQEVEDLTQEVFVVLLKESGRELRAWDPGRGLSLTNFVGLLAERCVASILRSGRRGAWAEDITPDSGFDELFPPSSRKQENLVLSRDLLEKVLDRLRAQLSPKGLQMFSMLVVDELPVETVCQIMQMTPDAVYAWRSRLLRCVRVIAAELQQEPERRGEALAAEARAEEMR